MQPVINFDRIINSFCFTKSTTTTNNTNELNNLNFFTAKAKYLSIF